jgi:hypothetical protein
MKDPDTFFNWLFALVIIVSLAWGGFVVWAILQAVHYMQRH